MDRFVDIGDCKLFVRDHGEGFPIVFGHSLSFDGDMWNAQQQVLGSKYRTLALDLRGHGSTQTPPEGFSLEKMADDLAAFMDQEGYDRIGYCGLSMGGMVGMRFALQHPDRIAALALLNTSAEAEPPDKRELYDNINESTRGLPPNEPTVSFILNLMFSPEFQEANPKTVEFYGNKLYHPKDQEGLYWGGKAVILREGIENLVDRIRCPTLVVVSDTDIALPPELGERIHQSIDGSKLLRLERSGHMSAVECADIVTTELQDFFDAHIN